MEFKWYAVSVISKKEKTAKKNIEAYLKINDLERFVNEIYVATETTQVIRDKKAHLREKVTFDSYIFVNAFLNGELTKTIKNADGVIDFVGGKNPIPMRLAEIQSIKKEAEKKSEFPFHNGDTIKILDGAFKSFKGTVEDVDYNKSLLKVGVSIFGRKTMIDLAFCHAESFKEE